MFGDWGGLILQILVTLVIAVVLVGGVYWLVRRYSAGGLGRIGRGRVPRLAIVDAMAVDGRRRLVLVRRDNVEHLILIGGPSDVVVEQAIQRPRRPAQKPAGEIAAEAPIPAAENTPIPFPQTRVQSSSSPPPFRPEAVVTSSRAEAPPPIFRPDPLPTPASSAPAATQSTPPYQPTPQPIERPFTPARRPASASPAAQGQPAVPPPRAEPAVVHHEPAPQPPLAAASIIEFEPMAPEPPLFPNLQPAINGEDDPPPAFMRRAANGSHGDASIASVSPTAALALDETAAKVNDLEREMARLLGEITTKKPA